MVQKELHTPKIGTENKTNETTEIKRLDTLYFEDSYCLFLKNKNVILN